MRRGATFDSTKRYRYWLWRTWDSARPRVAFVMLNPSAADHRNDDPTIRRCIGFANRLGYGSLIVANLFAFRTHSPKQLARTTDPIGPENDRFLHNARRRARDIVVAWGIHGPMLGRDQDARKILATRRRRPLLCLGFTAHGHPRHPLYLPNDTQLIRFS